MQIVTSTHNTEKKRRIVTLLKEQHRLLGSDDLYYFSKYILGYSQMEEQPHRGLCDFLMLPHKKKLILEPRGSFKSTIVTISDSIWRLLLNPNLRILIDSQDVTNAKKHLAELKGHFESNDEFKRLFGDWVGEKWSESEIVVNRRTKVFKEPSVMTGGVETPRVGMHVDHLKEDDLHSEHNVTTMEQIEKVIAHRNLNGSILEPGGNEDVVGTVWHFADLYHNIMEQERARRKQGKPPVFLIRRKGAKDKAGALHFPSRLTDAYLDERRSEMSASMFAMQYYNRCIDEESALFKKKWIKFYGRYAPTNIRKIAILDPAISERDEACNTAIDVIGCDPDGYGYVLDCLVFKGDPKVLIDTMFEVQKKWQVEAFGIESVAFQKALKYWAWERMRQTGQWINIVELQPDTRVTKDMRIKALVPYIESGTIQFPGVGPESLSDGVRQLYDEMIQYPVGKYVDALDALAYFPKMVRPASLPAPPPERTDTFEAYMKAWRQRKMRLADDGTPIVGGHAARIRGASVLVGVR